VTAAIRKRRAGDVCERVGSRIIPAGSDRPGEVAHRYGQRVRCRSINDSERSVLCSRRGGVIAVSYRTAGNIRAVTGRYESMVLVRDEVVPRDGREEILEIDQLSHSGVV
jgi:hypothetical protein